MLDLTVFYSKYLKILNYSIIKLSLTQDSDIVLNCKNAVNFFWDNNISSHLIKRWPNILDKKINMNTRQIPQAVN